MAELSYAGVERYRHSGRIDAARLALVFAVLLIAAGGIGAVYAVLRVYVHIWIVLSIMFFAGACAGISISTRNGLKWANVRNVPVAFLAALSIGAFGLGVSWLVWLWLEVNRRNVNASMTQLLFHPADCWDYICQLNAMGTFTLGHGDTVSGIALWGIWAGEAGGFLFSPVATVLKFLRDTPFCEQCVKWGTSRLLAQVNVSDNGSMRDAMSQKNFAYLRTLGRSSSDQTWFNVSMEGCGDCDSAPLLTVERVTVKMDKNGKATHQKKALLRHIILSADESTSLIMECAALGAPSSKPG